MPYSISALSRQGESQVKNSDNIYMNGVYMDSFTFSRYEKEQEIAGGASLLVLCAGYDDQSIARQFLRKVNDTINCLEDNTSPEEMFAAAAVCAMELDKSLPSGKKVLDVGVLAVNGCECYAVCFGEITVTIAEAGRVYRLCTGHPSGAIGMGNTDKSRVMPDPKRFSAGARVLMHTASVTSSLMGEGIEPSMAKPTAGECISSLDMYLEQVHTQEPVSMICMDIAPSANIGSVSRRLGKKELVAIAVAGIIAVAVLAGVIAAIAGSSSGKSKGVIREGGVSMEALKAQGTWNKTKDTITNNHKNMTDAKSWVETVEAAILGGYYQNVVYSAEMTVVTDGIATFNEKYSSYIDLYNKIDTLEGDDRESIVAYGDAAISAYNALVEAVPRLDAAKASKDEADKRAQTTLHPTQRMTHAPTQRVATLKPSTPKPTLQNPITHQYPTQSPATPKPVQRPVTPKPVQRPVTPKPTQKPKPTMKYNTDNSGYVDRGMKEQWGY